LGQGFQNGFKDPGLAPFMEAAVASRAGRIAIRQILPGSAGAHDPENAIHNLAVIRSRSPTTVGAWRVLRNKRLDDFPLLIGEFHWRNSDSKIAPSLPFLK